MEQDELLRRVVDILEELGFTEEWRAVLDRIGGR